MGNVRKKPLNELITEDMILFKERVNNWEEAIRLGAVPLLKSKMIEKTYIDKIISNVIEYGPYIVIAPYIAISHAKGEYGVNELGMSLLILKNAVNFSDKEDRRVHVLFTLAAPDNEQHILVLQQLSNLLLESQEELLIANDKESIMKLIEKYSNKNKKELKMKKIMAICGSGLGSSFLVEMNIKSVLKDMGVKDIEVEHADLGSAWPGCADLIVCGRDLEDNCKRFGDIIVLMNIMDKNELKEKLTQYFSEH